MKAKLLAPRNSAREILSDVDARRMLESGSWVLVTIPKPESLGVKRQRKFRRRHTDEGFKRLDFWVSEDVFNELQARRCDGESLAVLIKRLLELPDDCAENG